MRKQKIIWWTLAGVMLAAFVMWTVLVLTVNVKPTGPDGVTVGLAGLNAGWWQSTGTHAWAEKISDWLGYLTLLMAVGLAVWQIVVAVRGRSLRLARHWWVLDGVIIAAVACYLLFELVVINGRPLLVEGALKASYPSTHALLFATVLPWVAVIVGREVKNRPLVITVAVLCGVMALAGVILRAICGVHWFSDIIGGILLAGALDFIALALAVKPQTKE